MRYLLVNISFICGCEVLYVGLSMYNEKILSIELIIVSSTHFLCFFMYLSIVQAMEPHIFLMIKESLCVYILLSLFLFWSLRLNLVVFIVIGLTTSGFKANHVLRADWRSFWSVWHSSSWKCAYSNVYIIRVPSGPGKSWNLKIVLENPGKSWEVLEFHEFWYIENLIQ